MADETQEYILKTSFVGIDDADRYAQGIWEAARAEQGAAEAIRASSRAQRDRTASIRESVRARDEEIRFYKGSNRRLTETRDELALARKTGAGSDIIADLETRYNRLIQQVAREQAPDTGPVGPRVQLLEARQRLNRAKVAGVEGDRLADLEDMVKEAERRVARLAPKPEATAADRIAQAVTTSRFGNGIMPLVGRTAQAMGIENPTKFLSDKVSGALPTLATKEGGAVVGRISAVAAGVTLFGRALIEADRRLREFSDGVSARTREVGAIRDVSGGTMAQSITLGALGISGDQARSTVERIASDPIARGAAGRIGVSAVPGPYGTLNTAEKTLQIIQGLKKITSEEEKLRLARQMGAEALVRYTYLSEQTLETLKRDGELSARIRNLDLRRKTEEYEASKARLRESGDNLRAAADKVVLPTQTTWNNTWAGVRNQYAKAIDTDENGHLNWAKEEGRRFALRRRGLDPDKVDAEAKAKAQQSAESPMVQALKENTEAMNRLSRNYGTGPRGQRALPSGLQDGRNLAIAISTNQLRLGGL